MLSNIYTQEQVAQLKDKLKFDFYKLKGEIYHEIIQSVEKIFQERDHKLYQKEARLRQKQLRPPQNNLALQVSRIQLQLNQKIVQINQKLNQLEQRQKQNKQVTQIFKMKAKNSMDIIQETQKQLHKQLETVAGFLKSSKLEFQKMHQRYQSHLITQSQKWNYKFNDVSSRWGQIQNKFLGLQAFRTKQQILNKQFSSKILNLLQQQNKLEDTIQKHRNIFDIAQRNHQTIVVLERFTQDTATKLTQLQNFIEKYQPIYSYAQLSETLFIVLGQKYRQRLQQRDRKILNEFTIITGQDTGIPNLKRKVLKYRQLIQTIILRNKPYQRSSQKKVQQRDSINEEFKLENRLKNFVNQEIKKLQKTINGLQNSLKVDLTQEGKRHELQLNELQSLSELQFNKLQEKIDKVQKIVNNYHQMKLNLPDYPLQQQSHNKKQNSNYQFDHRKIFQKPKSTSNYKKYINIQTQRNNRNTNYGGTSHRYRILHQSESKIDNISSSCLIPENMLEFRRKSLIQMKRNKVVKKYLEN